METTRAKYESNRKTRTLDKEFLAGQRSRLEDMRAMLLRAHAGIEEEEREWTESIHYGKPDTEDVAARILAGELDTALDWRLMRRLGYIQRALEKLKTGVTDYATLRESQFPAGDSKRCRRRSIP